MIFRLSQRLARKVKAGKLNEMPLDANPCADWSCRLFIAHRKQYIILSNTMSLYSCVMYGKGVTDRDLFVGKTLDTIGELMTVDEQQHAYQRLVDLASAGVSFAKSLNRSVTGSMSDHVHGSKLYLEDGLAPHEIGVRLNDTPLSALTGRNGRRYAIPREVFVSLAVIKHG
jgi:hypothetical protein